MQAIRQTVEVCEASWDTNQLTAARVDGLDLFNRSCMGPRAAGNPQHRVHRDVIDLGLRSVDELINFTFSRVPHLRNPRASLDESAEHCLLGDDPCVVPGVRGDRNACRQRM